MAKKSEDPALAMAREVTGSELQSLAASSLELTPSLQKVQTNYVARRTRLASPLALVIAELAFDRRAA